jgi:autotransporter passenger strand-loop-strand repeat protein/autotransporter-associated beta strand protein
MSTSGIGGQDMNRPWNDIGLSAIHGLCHASGGSVARLEASLRETVQNGGIALSAAELVHISKVATEVWRTSGGSRAGFAVRLKERLGDIAGGRKFVAALALTCALQGVAVPWTAKAMSLDSEESSGPGPSSVAVGYEPIVSGTMVVTDQEIPDGGVQSVFSGGVTSNTLIDEEGVQSVYNGGEAFETYIDGSQYLGEDGAASSTVISDGGSQILTGGTATSTTIEDGGSQIVLSGNALQTWIEDGGVQSVAGEASATVISNGGTQIVTSGPNGPGIAYTTDISSGGTQIVEKGGYAEDTEILGKDAEQILRSGTAFGTFISSGARQIVSSGGVAENTEIYSKGSQIVSTGGIASKTQVFSNGIQTVSTGGVASGTRISSDGVQNVNGGTVFDTSIFTGGSQNVQSGGTASGTTIYAGGLQIVSSGASGNFQNTNIAAGASQVFDQGMGSAVSTIVEGVQILKGLAGASSGFTGNVYAESTWIAAGGVQSVVIGTATSTHVSAGGSQLVTGDGGHGHGLAVSTVVAANASQTLSGGGVASATSVAGTQFVEEGGSAILTSVTGTQIVSDGGRATSTTVLDVGLQILRSGAVANGVRLDSGGTVSIGEGASALNVVQSSGGILQLTVGGDLLRETVVSGTNGHGSSFRLSSGRASGFELYAGGSMGVSSGGVATSTTVYDGVLDITSNGLASATRVSGGTMNVSSGGSASATGLFGGDMNVFLGGTATSTTVAGGDMSVDTGGVARNTVISVGSMGVSTGGVISNTDVLSRGVLELASGAIAKDTDVRSGGTLGISDVFEAQGSTYIHDGAILEGAGAVSMAGDAASLLLEVAGTSSRSVDVGVTGTGDVLKLGTGKLTLTADLDFTGSTVVSGGTLVLTGTNSYDGGTWIQSGGTLEIESDDNIGSGSDNVLFSGGVLRLTGSSYTANWEFSGGGDASIETVASVTEIAGKLTGDGNLVKTGVNSLVLTGSGNTYNGNTIISGGTLAGNIGSKGYLYITSDGVYNGASYNNYREYASVGGVKASRNVGMLYGESGATIKGTSGLTVSGGVFSGNIDGTNIGGISKVGSGWLLLGGTNTYTGGVVIDGGVLAGNIAAGQDLTINAGAYYGGVYSASTDPGTTEVTSIGKAARTVKNLNGAGGLIGDTSGLTVTGSGSYGGVIDSTNVGGLRKTGAGILTLAGSNSYTGGTKVLSGGTLSIASDDNIGGANTTGNSIVDATLRLTGSSYSANWTLDPRTSGVSSAVTPDTGPISPLSVGTDTLADAGAETLVATPATLAATLDTTSATATTLAGLPIGSSDPDESDIGKSTGTATTGAGSGSEPVGYGGFQVLSGASATMTGTIDGAGALVKIGEGVLVLGGTRFVDGGSTYRNSYEGGTIVSAGTLVGNIAEGLDRSLTVSSGAIYHGDSVARVIGGIYGDGIIRNVGNSGGGLSVAEGDFGGQIVDTPVLTKVAPGDLTTVDNGTLTLTGENAFSGSLVIQAGTVAVADSGTVSPSKVTMWSGTTFDISEASAYTGGTDIGTGLTLTDLVIGKAVTYDSSIAAPAPGTAIWTAPVVSGNILVTGPGHDPALHKPALTYNVPSGTADGATLLTVDGSIHITDAVLKVTGDTRNIKSLKLVDVLSSKDVSKAPDSEARARYETNSGSYDTDTLTLVLESETGEQYELQIDPDDPNDLLAVLKSINPAGPTYERMKAYAEARVAAVTLVNQGQDLIIDKGMASALAATAGKGLRIGGFGAVGVGQSQFQTGSTVKASNQSLIVGIGAGGDTVLGRLAAGTFFEVGRGEFTTKNDFGDGVQGVTGKGNASFYGGGILARLDTESKVYVETSLRMGQARNDFSSGDLLYAGQKARYETSSLYYGGHFGLGYLLVPPGKNPRAYLDFSGKILWSHVNDSTATVSQDKLAFESVNSLRTRLGGRYGYAFADYITTYAGIYWEHEFGGAQKATVNGTKLGEPDLGGDTGIGEVGVTLRPTKKMPIFIDVGGQGFIGKRTGYSGNLQVRYEY